MDIFWNYKMGNHAVANAWGNPAVDCSITSKGGLDSNTPSCFTNVCDRCWN